MEKIRIGIIGYGNLGRGVEYAIAQNDDMELVGVFSRRAPESVKTALDTKVYSIADAENFKDKIDVMILCGGSATDLPVQAPQFVSMFNIVDSFDTHAKIPSHFENVNNAAVKSGKIGLISVGWDPGLFSLERLIFESTLPSGMTHTFWGKGISQGHSDAIRRIEGVADAKQYTIPYDEAIAKARSGEAVSLTTREKHLRECFVVLKEGADKEKIEKEIKEMPNYFADYNTIVHFISQEELDRDHSGIPHGGFVIRGGKTGENEATSHVMEFSLKLESNPEFTSSVIVAYARAAYRLYKEGVCGAKTVFDIPPAYLSQKSSAQLRAELL